MQNEFCAPGQVVEEATEAAAQLPGVSQRSSGGKVNLPVKNDDDYWK